MTTVYRLLGMVARVNHFCGMYSFNGITLNWAVVVIAAIALLISTSDLEEAENAALCWAVAGLSAIVLILFAQSMFRHDVVFRPLDEEPPLDPLVELPLAEIDFRVSGRFVFDQTGWTRWQRWYDTLVYGTSKKQWFLNAPAELVLPGKKC